jgi:hypothetical protein
LSILAFKAANAGKRAVAVPPASTSQACSGCGVLVQTGLSVRWHAGPECGTSLHRDHHAARNILALGKGKAEQQEDVGGGIAVRPGATVAGCRRRCLRTPGASAPAACQMDSQHGRTSPPTVGRGEPDLAAGDEAGEEETSPPDPSPCGRGAIG